MYVFTYIYIIYIYIYVGLTPPVGDPVFVVCVCVPCFSLNEERVAG